MSAQPDDLVVEFRSDHNLPAPRPAYAADPLPSLLAERRPVEWTVEGMLEAAALALLIGPEGSFKTFLAIALVMSIATGTNFCGRRVVQGAALYIAGEGRSGVLRRMRGWLIRHGIEAPELCFVGRGQITVVDPSSMEALAAFLKARMAEGVAWRLIVLDTLSRCFQGNENSSEDMAAAVRYVDTFIRELTGAAVLILHHNPNESRTSGNIRARGSTVLPGAADTIFTCAYDEFAKTIELRNTKQKDAEPTAPMQFAYDVVDLGEVDNFGNAVTTCVLRPLGVDAVLSDKPPAGAQLEALKTLQALIDAQADEQAESRITVRPRVLLQDWREACVGPSKRGNRKPYKDKSAFYRAVRDMESRRRIQREDGFVDLLPGALPVSVHSSVQDSVQ